VWFPAPDTAGLGLRRFDAARRLHISRFGKKCPAYRNQRGVPINSGKLKMNCILTNEGQEYISHYCEKLRCVVASATGEKSGAFWKRDDSGAKMSNLVQDGN
jgi:hypothetical protein